MSSPPGRNKKKQRAEVEVAKAEGTPFAALVAKATNELIELTETKAKQLSEVVQTIKVRGRGHYSKVELHDHKATMEEVLRAEKDITSQMTALVELGTLGRSNRDPCRWGYACNSHW